MDAVPAFGDSDILEQGRFQGVSQEGIIGRPAYMHIFHPEALGLRYDNGVRTTHVLLPAFIEHMHPVDGSGTGDGGVLHTGADKECLHPLAVVHAVGVGRPVAAVIAREVVLRNVGRVGVRVIHSLKHGPLCQVKVYIVFQVQRGR